MTKENVIVIEDEESILELISYNLEKEGYRVSGYLSGEEGLSRVLSDKPDLVVLDLMLPGIDGLQVCKVIKQNEETSNIPVIMISARGEEADVIKGLDFGADDYICKPFSPKLLQARARAVLRRSTQQPVDEVATISIHEITIDPVRHEVLLAGRAVQLTVTEFKVLHFLARHPGWVFTRYQIVDAAKGPDYAVTERSVDVQIVGLRKKLGDFGKYIETVRGVGYRFIE